eukprot:gene609-1036_t
MTFPFRDTIGAEFMLYGQGFLAATNLYLAELLPRMAPLQYDRGGPIIAMQLENEFGKFGPDPKYMRHLHDAFRDDVQNAYPQNALSLEAVYQNSFGTDGKGNFALDGKPHRILSGSIHYWRIPHAYWEHRLSMLRDVGLNTVETYVPWFLHERFPGNFSFQGDLDVEKFVGVAHSLGLLVILRPGPYICSEVDLGGLPSWLLREDGMRLRSSHQAHDITCMLMTCDFGTPQELDRGSEKGALPTVNFGPQAWSPAPAKALALLRKFLRLTRKDGQAPLMVMEMWAGWFDYWGEGHARVETEAVVGMMEEALEEGASFNLYMFHGGTNFGFTAGAHMMGPGKDYTSFTTSYDYDAAVMEDGRPSAKFLPMQVENLGRVTLGPAEQMHELKGLLGPVTLGGSKLPGDWDMYPLEMEEEYVAQVIAEGCWRKLPSLDAGAPSPSMPALSPGGSPVFLYGTLHLSAGTPIADTFLDTTGWRKGVVFINGFNIGRYWERGPQRRLYVPATLLKEGANHILLFEQEGITPSPKPLKSPVECEELGKCDADAMFDGPRWVHLFGKPQFSKTPQMSIPYM